MTRDGYALSTCLSPVCQPVLEATVANRQNEHGPQSESSVARISFAFVSPRFNAKVFSRGEADSVD